MSLPGLSIDVRRVAGNIGAEISGVRIAPDLPDGVVKLIRDALLEHKVVFFRDQHHLDDASQAGFAQRFGEMTKAYAAKPELVSEHNVLELDSQLGGKAPSWHTDATYTDRPPAMTMLRTVLLPPYGGDTAWANTVAAYENLGPKMREFADELRALHSNGHVVQGKRVPQLVAAANAGGKSPMRSVIYETEHPVVRVHPETGERAILLGAFTRNIVGREDSENVYELFQDRVTRLENTIRWRWSLGDFAIWDNRSTQHYAIHDYGDLQRKVHRCTIAGDIPVGVDGRSSVALKGDASTFATT
jgi:taurine dioxygenase